MRYVHGYTTELTAWFFFFKQTVGYVSYNEQTIPEALNE